MVLQEDGPISLEDVQNEFGGDDPINFNEYYPNAYTGYSGHENDLLLWLKFDSSIVQDFSSHNHSISKFTGTTPTLEGVDNKKGDSHLKISANTGYVINQSTKYVIPDGTAELSVCFWMRNQGSDDRLFRYRPSLIVFGNYANTNCGFDMTNITNIWTSPLFHTEWKHYVFTVIVANGDSSTKVYIDGIDNTNSWSKGTNAGIPTGFTNSGAESSGTKFGLFFNHYYYAGDYTQYFQGDVDDFRIYNKALSQTEVQHVIGYTTPLSQNSQLLIKENTDPIDLSTFYGLELSKVTFEYPPNPMTTHVDNGMYTGASTSYNWSTGPHYAFDKVIADSNRWISQDGTYDFTTGVYNNSRGLTDIYGTKHFGEWIQIRFLNKNKMDHCLIYPVGVYPSANDGVILGTNKGTYFGTDGTWVVISSFYDKSYTANVGTKINIDTGGAEYKYYAVVGKVVSRNFSMTELKFFSTTPTINTNGLEFYIDTMSSSSYSGSGSTIYNLLNGAETATLAGTYSLDTSLSGVRGIRLFNTSGTRTSNVSRVNVNKTINITTVSIWLYIHSIPTTVYILDSRTGMSSGYIYNGGSGPDWATGKLYVNGGSQQSILWSSIATTGVWRNITFVANNPGFDSMNLFSRYSNNEGLNVTFGPIMIYNRELSEEENRQNYNYYCEAFGLRKDTVEYPPMALTSNNSNGYICTKSSINSTSWDAWKAFNKIIGNEGYHSSGNTYRSSDGAYISNKYLTDTSNTNHSGEWLQLQLPVAKQMVYCTLAPRTGFNYRCPRSGVVMGSNTGVNGSWVLVTEFSNKSYSDGVETEIIIDSNEAYLYYVLLCKTISTHSTSATTLNISEVKYFAHH